MNEFVQKSQIYVNIFGRLRQVVFCSVLGLDKRGDIIYNLGKQRW